MHLFFLSLFCGLIEPSQHITYVLAIYDQVFFGNEKMFSTDFSNKNNVIDVLYHIRDPFLIKKQEEGERYFELHIQTIVPP
jgi:hypothetical protein